MASTIKVDQIEGSTGSTITVPTGQTLTLTDGLGVSSLPTVTVAKGGTNLESFTAGDILYATGATTLAKLAKGTAAQQLAMNAGATAPEWVAAAGGGAWTLIKSVTASADSSIDFVDGTDDVVLDNTYFAYRIVGVNIAGDSDNAKIYIHFSEDTGSTWENTNYQTNIYKMQPAYDFRYNGTTDAFTMDSTGTAAYETCSFEYTVFDPSISDDYTHYSFNGVESQSTSVIISFVGGGKYKSAAAVDGIRIIAGAGNLSGDCMLYGLARS